MGNHSCYQVCINTAGSYICDCDDGYVLNVDKRTCDGESTKSLLYKSFSDFKDRQQSIAILRCSLLGGMTL